MSNLRKIDNDILKDWFLFRENTIIDSCRNEKRYEICFDDIYKEILNNVPRKSRESIENKLKLVDEEFLKLLVYWEEKYYRNGFCDGINLIIGTLENNNK